MTSMKYCSKIIKENLKRFWGIGVFYVMFVLITDMFPLMLAHSKKSGISSYLITSILDNETFAIMMYQMLAPILIAVILFRYLQQSHSAAVCHGWPMTRRDLFIGNTASGWIILMVPLLIRWVIVLIYKEPIYSNAVSGEDLYTLASIMEMGAASIAVNTLVYTIALTVTMITGSSVFQAILSFGFLFFFPALGELINMYFVSFLFGYENYLSRIHFFNYLTPLAPLFNSVNIDYKISLYYLIASALLGGIAFWLYKIRPLEHASDPIAIDFMIPLFKLVAAFVGMSLVGFYVKSLATANGVLEILGFVLGIALALVLAEMIVQKTFWFVRNTKSYLFFTLVTLAFLMILRMDVFGYESSIPELAGVESVVVQAQGHYISPDETQLYQDYLDKHKITDRKTVQQILDYHQEIVSKQDLIDQAESNDWQRVILKYQLDGGKTLVRGYDIPKDVLYEMDSYETLSENDIYQVAYADITHLEVADIDSIILHTEKNLGQEIVIESAEDLETLLEKIEMDLMAETFEEQTKPYKTFTDFSIEYKSGAQLDRYFYTYYYEVKEHYTEVMGWFEDKGYAQIIRIHPEEVDYAKISKIMDDQAMKEAMVTQEAQLLKGKPESTEEMQIADDLSDLQLLLDVSYQYGNINYELRAYDVTFVLKSGESINRLLYEKEVPSLVEDYFR